jgi:hypothetical protein
MDHFSGSQWIYNINGCTTNYGIGIVLCGIG